MKSLARKVFFTGVVSILWTLPLWTFTYSTMVAVTQQAVAQQRNTGLPILSLEARSSPALNPFRRPQFDQPPNQATSGPYIEHVISKRSIQPGTDSENPTRPAKSPLPWQTRSANTQNQRPKQDVASGPAPPDIPEVNAAPEPRPRKVPDKVPTTYEPKLFHPPENAVSLADANAPGLSKTAPLPKPSLVAASAALGAGGSQPAWRIQPAKDVVRKPDLHSHGEHQAVSNNRKLGLASRPSQPRKTIVRQPHVPVAESGEVAYESDLANVDSLLAAPRRPRRSSEVARLVAESRGTVATGYSQLEPNAENPFADEDSVTFGPNFTSETHECFNSECVCGCGDVSCDVCGASCCDDGMCEILSVEVPRPRELTLFGGVHAFKGPLDLDRDSGNFGIHEGLNWGGKFPWFSWSVVGYQIGYQLVHSQLHGSENGATADPHTQQFLTAGLFRRTQCGGWQYGLVWDMLRDERANAADFHQLRGELGFVGQRGREFGFMFTAHTNDTSVGETNLRAVDQYLLYYRIHASQGGEARFFGGFDDTSKGVLGANVILPVHDRWSVQSGFTYMVPEQNGEVGAQKEAWNLGINLVWHFDARARRCHSGYYRPLFDVADNGSLIVDSRP